MPGEEDDDNNMNTFAFPLHHHHICRWFKEENEQLTPIKFNERIFIVSGGLLKISKAKIEDSGKYLCWVNNTAGEETIEVLLTITGNIRHFPPVRRSFASVSADAD